MQLKIDSKGGMAQILSSRGYVLDERTHVWRRPEANGIDYSDGAAAEKRIRDAVLSVVDRSVDSPEWDAYINDWTSEYHLSAQRCNLLRPLPIATGQRVVELGAGCGALTRWLGEQGAEVVAVEGSLDRAEIIALRCEDLPNVTVVADDLLEVPPLAADWVLLIGVLEYAPVFRDSPDPVADVLNAARSQLAANGTLVVAIENQLGLKYFAGCGEDHVGRPFFGIEDLYHARSAITFGKTELQERLTRSGFPNQRLLLPFPDYKLPFGAIDTSVCDEHPFDIASFVGLHPSRDYAGSGSKAFTEALAWQAVSRNGIVADLANSFLVLASRDGDAPEPVCSNGQALAWSYGVKRAARFTVDTCIRRSGGELRVFKSFRSPCVDNLEDSSEWFHRIEPDTAYFPGKHLDLILLEAAVEGDREAFLRKACAWLDLLLSRSVVDQPENGAEVGNWMISGDAVDLTPRNIVVGTDGVLREFDQEWGCRSPVPLAWVLMRGLVSLLPCAINGDWVQAHSVVDLVRKILGERGISMSDKDVDIAFDHEMRFLSWVSGRPVEAVRWPRELLLDPIGRQGKSLVTDALVSNPDSAKTLSKMQDLQIKLDSETMAHVRLIGAYENADKSNRSLIEQLTQAHAYAAREMELHVAAATALEGARHQLQTAIVERDAARDAASAEYGSRIRELVEINDGLAVARDGVMREVIATNELLAQSQQRGRQMEEQVALLNSQVVQLNAERATIGAAIGRRISHLRVVAAPVGSKRARLLTKVVQFVAVSRTQGLPHSLARTLSYLMFKMRSSIARSGLAGGRLDFVGADLSRSERPGAGRQEESVDAQFRDWIAAHEPTADQIAAQVKEAEGFDYAPLFSVIIPVYRVPREVLDDTLTSLERQSYRKWQACIVWADVEDDGGWNWLASRIGSDPRYVIERLTENGGISNNSNAALELADGEFVALLDHDDTLTPWAFFDLAKVLQASPELDFLYSDKDSITADGAIRMNAYFKPSWSPEMLHSVNYLTHLNLIRTALVRDIGGWREETDGAQDWDLFFRVTERTGRIARVPSIHYHWRVLPTSTASGMQAKPYAALGQLRAQRDHFLRRALPATVSPSPEGMFHVGWPAAPGSVDVAVVQTGSQACLVSVLEALKVGHPEVIRRILVVTSEKPSESLRSLESSWEKRLRVVVVDEADWLSAYAASIEADDSVPLVMIDGGASCVSPNIVQELAGWVLHHPEIAWCSAIVTNGNGTVYESGRVLGTGGRSAPLFFGSPLFTFGWFGGPSWYRNARACSPCAVAIRTGEAIRAMGVDRRFDGGRDGFAAFCCAMTEGGRRGMIDPFAQVAFDHVPEEGWANDGDLFRDDPYFHPAFARVSPLRLRS